MSDKSDTLMQENARLVKELETEQQQRANKEKEYIREIEKLNQQHEREINKYQEKLNELK